MYKNLLLFSCKVACQVVAAAVLTPWLLQDVTWTLCAGAWFQVKDKTSFGALVLLSLGFAGISPSPSCAE